MERAAGLYDMVPAFFRRVWGGADRCYQIEMDIAAGGECVYEEKLVMLLLKRLPYPENAVREAGRGIVRNGWEMPEESCGLQKTG